MSKRLLSGLTAALFLLSLAACSKTESEENTGTEHIYTENTTASGETQILLSDEGVTVNGKAASTDTADAVYIANDIIYYQDGTDETYGEGSAQEMHSAEEAAAHTVVHITQPGTYRISGAISAGQLFVDLGEDAESDPEAVVTLILDGTDITCTVAPAVFFYRVYECCDSGEDTGGVVDTTAAGANVILADGSENTVSGSHVARIYQEGTTKKLHKYDGAFYSKMSMNLDGDAESTGILNIVADNEGLNSELHLTINGGIINISAQDDGINTNEDYISVTTINGGTLTIDAGLGSEGDGIDSNGYLTINGGTIYSYANGRSGDGGLDADSPITINGGTIIAFGSRNDAADSASAQPYMELSFATTLPDGSVVEIRDTEDNPILSATAKKDFQSLTLSSGDLALDTTYYVYVDGVQQQYTGNASGFIGGMGPQPGNRGDLPENMTPPENIGESPDGEKERPADLISPDSPDAGDAAEGTIPPNYSAGPPEDMPGQADGLFEDAPGFQGGPGDLSQGIGAGEASVDFTLTDGVKSFSGVSDAAASSGKLQVRFTVDGLESVASGLVPEITAIVCDTELDSSQVQITVTDNPSENYAETCLLSDGLDAVNALLPTDDGNYLLTVAVVSENADYTGVSQFRFSIGAE